MDNIIVAMDLTDLSEYMVSKAVDLAQKYNSKVWLIHVAAPDPDFVGYDPGPSSVRDQRAEELRKEHRQLQAIAKEAAQQNVEVESLLIQGATVKTILEKVETLKADLIIVGAHSHSWLYERLFGSLWPEIVNNAKIPVLVVPEPKVAIES